LSRCGPSEWRTTTFLTYEIIDAVEEKRCISHLWRDDILCPIENREISLEYT